MPAPLPGHRINIGPDCEVHVNIGPDLKTHADMQTLLHRGDVAAGRDVGLGDHVVYHDPGPGHVDHWKDPETCNKDGHASCNAMSRAVASEVGASHFGLVATTDPETSEVKTHGFLVKKAAPGEPSIKIGTDGKALSPIPASRIHDEAVLRGMNGKKPLPLSTYQGATLSPYWPPDERDLSHLGAPPAERLAAGHAYQGAPRLHIPETAEGAKVAEVAHVAARLVKPPIEHVARPLEELYDAGRSAEERIAHAAPFRATERTIKDLGRGLEAVAAGVLPVEVAGEAPLDAAHRAAASALLRTAERIGEVKQIPEKIVAFGAQLAAMPAGVERDQVHAAVSELDALLPGVVPHEIRRHLGTPTGSAGRPAFALMPLRNDRGGINLSASLAMGVALFDVLRARHVGCPGDGRRPPRPARVPDPRMGAAPAAVPAAPAGGASMGGGGGGGMAHAPAPAAPSSLRVGSPASPLGTPSSVPFSPRAPSRPSAGSAPASGGGASAAPPPEAWHGRERPWRDHEGRGWWREGGRWFRDGIIVDEVEVPIEVTEGLALEAPEVDEVETVDEDITVETPPEEVQIVEERLMGTAGPVVRRRRRRRPQGAMPTVVEVVETRPPPRPKRRWLEWLTGKPHRPEREILEVSRPRERFGSYERFGNRRPTYGASGSRSYVDPSQRARDSAGHETASHWQARHGQPLPQKGSAAWWELMGAQNPRMAGVSGPLPGLPHASSGMRDPPMGWLPQGRDFVIVDPGLRAAVDAYRHDKWARAFLERGGRIHGHGLHDVRAVLEPHVIEEIVDPRLAGLPGIAGVVGPDRDPAPMPLALRPGTATGDGLLGLGGGSQRRRVSVPNLSSAARPRLS